MAEEKEQALSEIRGSFTELSGLVMRQLITLERLLEADDDHSYANLLKETEETEKRIDHLEVVISEQFTNVLVLWQPMAHDVRSLVAIYRMAMNLERIGDLIHNLCRSLGHIRESNEFISALPLVREMLSSGSMMVEKALHSFTGTDPASAIWTISNDSVIDRMNHELLPGWLRQTGIDSQTLAMLERYIELREIVSNIERIADHATNIAEASIYSMQGTDIRHTGIGKGEELG